MKKFLSKKWLGIPLFAIIAVILAVGVAAAAVVVYTPVSNLWTSPQVVVTVTHVPELDQLAISSSWTANATSPTEIAFDFPVTLVNTSEVGAPTYNNVTVDIKIWNATNDINPADLTLQYFDGTTYQTIPTTAVNSAGIKLETTFGPSTGFPVAPGYNVTTQFRVVFHKAGTYVASAQAQTHP